MGKTKRDKTIEKSYRKEINMGESSIPSKKKYPPRKPKYKKDLYNVWNSWI